MHNPPISVQQNVSVMAILQLEEITQQRVSSQRVCKIFAGLFELSLSVMVDCEELVQGDFPIVLLLQVLAN